MKMTVETTSSYSRYWSSSLSVFVDSSSWYSSLSSRTHRLVDDFLDYTTMKAKKAELQPHAANFCETVEKVIQELYPIAQARDVCHTSLVFFFLFFVHCFILVITCLHIYLSFLCLLSGFPLSLSTNMYWPICVLFTLILIRWILLLLWTQISQKCFILTAFASLR